MTHAHDEAALQLLRNPERFPSLPRRSENERRLSLWREPSFIPLSSWSLFQDGSSFVVRRLEYDRSLGLPIQPDDPHIYGSEAIIDAARVRDILATFAALEFPVFRSTTRFGLDGVRYGLRFGDHRQGVELTWGQEAEGWEALIALFEQTAETLDALLPESTLRLGRLFKAVR
ncbi:MAG TPA: hypothetical protein VM847_08475 [Tahibacter sp.]|nr:hypothetical protein [Tahibacter sp.]